MIQETMLYSVKTAVMGMLVVFTFLVLLSLLMWAIKLFFSIVLPASATDELPSNGGKRDSGVKANAGQPPYWLVAAAAAYLLIEEREQTVSADPWRPATDVKSRMWIVSGGFG